MRNYILLVVLLLLCNKLSLAQADSIQIEIPKNLDIPKVSDLKINKLGAALPDTLYFQKYALVVEKYTSKNIYNRFTKEFEGLSGYGRILFKCSKKSFLPNLSVTEFPEFSQVTLVPQSFTIVETVKDAQSEMTLKDARYFLKDASRGKELVLMLPQKIDLRKDYLKKYKNQIRPKLKIFTGIRFSFENVKARKINFRRRTARVISGVATYPSIKPKPIPTPPFSLSLNGFTLEVEAMTLFPNKTGEAKAKLILPKSISEGNDCKRASLDLGTIQLFPNCEFYKTEPRKNFGEWNIANTNLTIKGRGYIADFRSNFGAAPTGGSNSWKGLILSRGGTIEKPSGTIYSNTGYLCADYRFRNAHIDVNGFTSDLVNNSGYEFTSIQPFDYNLTFKSARLKISKNKLSSGRLNNINLTLPQKAVLNADGSLVTISTPHFDIDNSFSIAGSFSKDSLDKQTYFWGEYDNPNSKMMSYGVIRIREGFFYLPGNLSEDFYPLYGDQFRDITPQEFNLLGIKNRGVFGLTLRRPEILYINSPDLPGADKSFPAESPVLLYQLGTKSKQSSWINIGARGVHAGLYANRLGFGQDYTPIPLPIGNPESPYYEGEIPFVFGGTNFLDKERKRYGSIDLQFVESAVFHSDVKGVISLPAPTNDELYVDELVFTSTAQIAGGKIDLSEPTRLDYWGLDVVPKPGHSTSGVLSVKTGQVLLTAAGLAEPRHFAEPFYVRWGEILANGNTGRMFFDHHNPGQQFDGFDFSPEAITLSPFIASTNGFLRVGGTAYFPFFGDKYLHILDTYDPSLTASPFDTRKIEISNSDFGGNYFKSDSRLTGNWAEGSAVFDLDILYDDATQFGFLGTGTSNLSDLIGGLITSSIQLTADYTCISFNENNTRSFYLGATEITGISEIWGCACIKDNRIDNLVFGGSMTSSANTFMIGNRVGQYAQLIVRETPAISEFTIDGQATLSAVASVDLLVNGHFSMLFNKKEAFIEGEVSGDFRAAAGAIFVGNSLSGRGEANWHISLNPIAQNAYHSIQGSIAMNIMSFSVIGGGSGTSLNAGFYFGSNAPTSEAWVIQGADPRYQFNMSALPNRLTGVYGFLQIKAGRSFFLFSGGYEVFVGLGAFVLTDIAEATGLGSPVTSGFTPGVPYILGNLGGRIYGEILGGFVSASAFFNIQILGPNPILFQGRVGLEGCVLWVACKSVTLTVGLSSNDGFYIE